MKLYGLPTLCIFKDSELHLYLSILHVYYYIYSKRDRRLPVTVDSSRAKTPSNRLSDRTAQGLCRPIRNHLLCFTMGFSYTDL